MQNMQNFYWFCRLFFAVFFALSLASCAGFKLKDRHKTPFENERTLVKTNQLKKALLSLEKYEGKKQNSEILQYLQTGVLYFRLGNWQKSNEQLEKAKKLNRHLVKTSLKEQTSSYLLNSNTQAFVANKYDVYWLYLLKLLNFSYLKDDDGLQVELNQLDVLLQANKKDQVKLKESSFLYYVSGIMYEKLAKYDDAIISYRNAYQAYKSQPPIAVLNSYARLLSGNSYMRDEFKAIVKKHKLNKKQLYKSNNKTQCVGFYFDGVVNAKKSKSFTSNGVKARYTFDIPYYKKTKENLPVAILTDSKKLPISVFQERISTKVSERFKQELPGIITKTIARIVLKTSMLKGQDSGVSILASLYLNLTEGADLRSWNLLPNYMLISKNFIANNEQCSLYANKQKLKITGNVSHNRVSILEPFIVLHR